MSHAIFGQESGTVCRDTLARLNPDDVRSDTPSDSRGQSSRRLFAADDRRGLRGSVRAPLSGADDEVAIIYGGRCFIASATMADRFALQARRLIDCGETELVALLHAEGVDLLLIAETIPFSVGTGFAHLPASRR